jgi:hypothetical protein
MGRSVGAKAAQAVAAGQVKAAKVITIDQAVLEIRAMRAARLFVGNMEFVDKLLEAHDNCMAINNGELERINQYLTTPRTDLHDAVSQVLQIMVTNQGNVDDLQVSLEELQQTCGAHCADVDASPVPTRDQFITVLCAWEGAVQEDNESHSDETASKLETARNTLMDMLRSAKANIAAAHPAESENLDGSGNPRY